MKRQSSQKTYRFGIRTRLTAFLLLFSVLPILLVSVYLYESAKASMEKKVISHLVSLTDTTKADIEIWLDNKIDLLNHLAGDIDFGLFLLSPETFFQNGDSPSQTDIHHLLRTEMEGMKKAHSLASISLFDRSGRVVVSSGDPGEEDTSDKNLVTEILRRKEIIIDDIYISGNEERRMRFSAPVWKIDADLNRIHRIVGVITFEANITQLERIITRTADRGESQEFLLVRRENDQIVYLSCVRHTDNERLDLRIPVDSPFARPAVFASQGDEGLMRLVDHRGKDIIALFRYIPSMDWGFVAKIDEGEAMAPLAAMKKKIALFTGILLVFVIAFSLLFTKGITTALLRLENLTKKVAGGDYSRDIDISRNDEIGSLADSFHTMLANLRQQRDLLNQQSRELEEKVRERTQELYFTRFAIDRVSMAAIWITPRGEMIYVNDATCRLLGYSRDELLTMSIPDVNRNFSAANWSDHWQEVREKKSFTFETTAHTKNGEDIPVEVFINHVQFGDREYNCSFVRDITEQKIAEQEKRKFETYLRQSQKMEAIGTLAGGIAHDFNNILAPIICFTEMLLESENEGSQNWQDLNEVLNAANRAKELVKQILRFSREKQQELAPLLLAPIIKEAFKLLSSTLPSTIEIRENISPEPLTVLADPTQINQLVMNLATNAFHAMQDEEGVIEVSLKRRDQTSLPGDLSSLPYGTYAELMVRDTGCGMDSLTRERIFEPYFTTKDQEKGTGLGLAVVHGIVRDYKGGIHVESEVGRGTTFFIYLPLHRDSVEPVAGNQEQTCQSGSERILLVDDEELIAKSLERSLKKLGYRVQVETNSPTALAEFRSNPEAFDLVITDQTMPRLTGDQLSAELLAIRPDIPIIMCTGYSSKIDKDKAKNLGIKSFLVKPVTRRDLARTIRRVLDPLPPS